jgi:hypothetical protein
MRAAVSAHIGFDDEARGRTVALSTALPLSLHW